MANLVNTLKSVGPGRLLVLIGTAAALLGLFAFIGTRVTQPSMSLLFSNLDLQESAQIVAKLEAMKVPYRLSGNGNVILVPEEQVLRLRMSMAESGLPSGGSVGYEIFDRSDSLGATSFVQNINHARALEGELARTIRAIDGIQAVRVHLVLPKREVFARENREPSREEALFKGYTVVDPATVIITHLTEVLKDNMADLLTYAETQKLLDDLPKTNQKLISDLVPARITVNGVQRVLQNLLAERVSIRDLSGILEAITEACGFTQSVTQITEHVRGRLARQISNANVSPEGWIPLVALSPQWEQDFAESLVGQGEDRQLSMAPSRLQEFIANVRQSFDRLAAEGQMPVLLTSPGIRPYVRSIIERFRPATVVLSQAEIHPKSKLRTLAQI